MLHRTMAMTPDRICVLLVDDDRDNREMYADYLEFTGMFVRTACRAADALASIALEAPDVVVSDLHLSEMSGVDLIRTLKGNAATAAVPVILLTGEAFGNFREQAREAGSAEVCLKPCLPDALADAITRVLSGRRGARQPRAWGWRKA
jgi:CheY-like chemotaxis protein